MTARRKASAAGRAPRERGTGSISSYRTKAGLRWRFEIPAPIDPARPEEGSRDISRGGFTSYDEADGELTLLRADLIPTNAPDHRRGVDRIGNRSWTARRNLSSGYCGGCSRSSRGVKRSSIESTTTPASRALGV